MRSISKNDQIGTKKTKRKKKNPRLQLIRDIDTACSLATRHNDYNKAWDGCKGAICNNHLITRSNFKTRWFPMNCFSGTTGANYRHEQNPHYMVTWFVGKYGSDEYKKLVDFSIGIAKWSMSELREMLHFWEYARDYTREELTYLYFNTFRRFAPDYFEFINDDDMEQIAGDRVVMSQYIDRIRYE